MVVPPKDKERYASPFTEQKLSKVQHDWGYM